MFTPAETALAQRTDDTSLRVLHSGDYDERPRLSALEQDTLPVYGKLPAVQESDSAQPSLAVSEHGTMIHEKAASAGHYAEKDTARPLHTSSISTSSGLPAPESTCSSSRLSISGYCARRARKMQLLSHFVPTVQLQVQAGGKPWLSLPSSQRAGLVPIFPLVPRQSNNGDGDRQLVLANTPQYVSIRPSQNSRSRLLMTAEQFNAYSQNVHCVKNNNNNGNNNQNQAGADSGTSPTSTASLLRAQEISRTTYRFGTSEWPLLALLGKDRQVDNWYCFKFLIQSKGVATRAVEFEPQCFLSSFPRTGGELVEDKFTWRYAGQSEMVLGVGKFLEAWNGAGDDGNGKGEKKPDRLNSVLVLERNITTITQTEPLPASSSPLVSEKPRLSSSNEITQGNDKGGAKDKTLSFFSRHRKHTTTTTTTNKTTRTHVVALLVRSNELRSPGTSASSAGNGGRLFIDLRSFREDDASLPPMDGDGAPASSSAVPGTAPLPGTTTEQVEHGASTSKDDTGEKLKRTGDIDFADHRELAQRIIVTTALVMLKREVNRRRARRIGALAFGLSVL